MNLNTENLERYIERFRGEFPDFVDFEHPGTAYIAQERAYKDELRQVFLADVRPALDPLPDDVPGRAAAGEKAAQLFTRTLKTINGPQNLVGWRYWQSVQSLPEEDRAEWAALVSSLIDEDKPQAERIDAFVAGLEALFERTGTKQTAAAPRAIASLFLFLENPGNHIFIKTREMRRALQFLGGPDISRSLTGESYGQVQAFARSVWALLKERGVNPKDMIDIQSFLWVATRERKEKEDAPVSAACFEVALTEGAITNGYIRVGPPGEFFPERFYGGSSEGEIADQLTLLLEDGSERQSDIRRDGSGGRLRARFTKYFKDRRVQPGDVIRIRPIQEGRYALEIGGREQATAGGTKTVAQQTHPQNLILYGPPGTGKTYDTARISVEMCDGSAPADRSDVLTRYRELVANKRISFVTFHQSFGYEEFVEGIRPVVPDSAEQADRDIQFEVRDGIFKRICRLAKEVAVTADKTTGSLEGLEEREFFKMSVGGLSDPEAERFCFENGYVSLGWGVDTDFSALPMERKWEPARDAIRKAMVDAGSEHADRRFAVQAVYFFRNRMQKGDIVIVPRGLSQVQAIGVVEGDYEYRPEESVEHQHFRKVRWLVRDAEIPVEKIQDKIFSQQSIYMLSRDSLDLEYLRELLSARRRSGRKTEPYVLIIDEINRGNVSKVFGELITLLEPDKRLGAAEEIVVKLPYSGESFGVPGNLHVLGTMNTADRSIALLDTALRRRFEFREVMPDAQVIEGAEDGRIPDGEGGWIDLRALLRAVNVRIEYLLGRDQQIGHAYLMQVKDLLGLEQVFRRKIIPLLLEYFHEDWRMVQLVLSGQFVSATGELPEALFAHAGALDVPIGGNGNSFQVSARFTPEMFRRLYGQAASAG